jgi:DNA-binding beta-propeller fold protein YncE
MRLRNAAPSIAVLALALMLPAFAGRAAPVEGEAIPTGQRITPAAAPGALFQKLDPHLASLPDFRAGQASATALSPDGKTLLILTSGFNRNFLPNGSPKLDAVSEYIFVFDVSGPTPVQRQALHLANTFEGLAWAPDGRRFYVSAGVDDNVQEYEQAEGGFRPARKFPLGHKAGLGVDAKPEAAGLAISPDGRRLIVANLQNDSVSLIDLTTAKVSELDLRPGKLDPTKRGLAGGTFPRAVAFTSDRRAWVGSERDRELIALDLGEAGMTVTKRIRTRGQPVALLASPARNRLYVALDNTDEVMTLDPERAVVLEAIASAAPKAMARGRTALGGVNTNALALAPDGRTLLASNGGENAVAVIRLSPVASGLGAPARPAKGDDDDKPRGERSEVVGLIPTGWYPTGVAVDARRVYVVNGKSNSGPNPGACRDSFETSKTSLGIPCRGTNGYVWQLEKAGFLTLPIPSAATLGELTRQVAVNDGFETTAEDRAAEATLAQVRSRIRHVIYIVKENRTYDQVLGDLGRGDSDPKLNLFPRAMTPNHHALARQFVDLDRFFDSGESSNTGWNWTMAARTNDFTEREAPVNYAQRGLQYDQEGSNRNVNVGIGDGAARIAADPATPKDPDLLAGPADVAGLDGPGGDEGHGYLWDAALRAHLSLRNYGFFGDLSRYELNHPDKIALERDPHAKGLTVFFPTKAALIPVSDPYFRSFDQSFPDYWRFQEWKREFDAYGQAGDLPRLTFLRLNHDHFGRFGEGIDKVDTVETEMADNDYAVGLVVEAVSKSRFAKDTLIFVVEDDAQDGADHVDSHRSLALVAGPYVKQGAVVSHRYTTVNLVKTLEAVLGLAPMNLNDALAQPMAELFDLSRSDWSYRAEVAAILRTTDLPLPPAPTAAAEPRCRMAARSASWWAAATKGQNFDVEDHLDTAKFNRALWRGMQADKAACVKK